MRYPSTLVPAAAALLFLALAGCAADQASHPANPPAAHAASGPAHSVSADDALRTLMDGNARYVAEHPSHAVTHAGRRTEVASGQHPIAIVVCCADSRVGPEIVFDQGIGDIFVVRTAGNVVGDIELGSIEYAVEHLHAPLIIVTGHERCGAVTAAVEGGHAPAHLSAFISQIEPAVADSKGLPGDPVDNAVRSNVRHVVQHLSTAGPVLDQEVRAGKLKIVGARYDLDTGKVELVH